MPLFTVDSALCSRPTPRGAPHRHRPSARATPVRRQQELGACCSARVMPSRSPPSALTCGELGVVKHSDGYVLPDNAELSSRAAGQAGGVAARARRRTAGASITVVKTTIGSAGSVAAAIDKAGWSDVAGTVSGDDTIFIATADARAQARVLEQLRDAFGV